MCFGVLNAVKLGTWTHHLLRLMRVFQLFQNMVRCLTYGEMERAISVYFLFVKLHTVIMEAVQS